MAQAYSQRTRVEMMRSKLFVPGSRPELFEKALRGAADALSFDLEDSVTTGRKQEARNNVAKFLREEHTSHGKLIIVRVNADDSVEADLRAVVTAQTDIINLPKVDDPEQVFLVVDLLEKIESTAGSVKHVGLLANIETPKGLRLAAKIAAAHPRVVGLQIGVVDLFHGCGIDPRNIQALNSVRIAVRMAASEAGVAAFDGAYANVQDAGGFRQQAEDARSLGLNGKSCIHPSQVEVANQVFSPSKAAIDHARRIVVASLEENHKEHGAFLLDGQMIDAPILEHARQVLQRSQIEEGRS